VRIASQLVQRRPRLQLRDRAADARPGTSQD
jgi:hypothetical protein